jgi:tetratricopeptide (TPR) repeat protein
MLPPERPLPSASGSLDKRPLAHLLVYALERKLTGTMELVSPEESACFYVVEGQPQKVWTSKARGPTSGDGGPDAALTRMEALFDMPSESTFAYYDGFDAVPDEPSHAMPPFALVWRGIKRAPPWEHVHAALTRIGNAPLRLSAPAGDVLSQFAFDANERQLVVQLVSTPSTMHDLVNAGILAPGRVQLLVYCLLITKKAEVSAVSLTPAPSELEAAAPLPPEPPVPPPPALPSSAASSASSASSAVARVRLARPATRPGFREEKSQISPADRRGSQTPPPHVAIDHAAHAARRAEIVARAQSVDTEDYFTMLAIGRDATGQQVQAAFFALAKGWHPDRLPSGLADVKDACSRVFARMSEAHQTLADNERRGRYMRLLVEGGATPKDQETIASVIEAATSFQKAEILLKRGDLVQAEALCRRAAKLDTKQADYHALLAWLEGMKAENQGVVETRSLIGRLGEAIALNASCERAYFYRGLLHKRLKNDAAAIKDFRSAAELNPRNVDAQREVRLHTMRAGSGAPGKPKARADGDRPNPSGPPAKPGKDARGFLNRLFKK